MKVREADGKRLLAEAGIHIPRSVLARTPAAAGEAFAELGVPSAVVKAHVAAGGRGKAGLVRSVSSAEEARDAAAGMLECSHQGELVEEVLVEEAVDHADEVYVGVTVDARAGRPALMVVSQGGVEVESVGPDAGAFRMKHFEPGGAMSRDDAEQVARGAGVQADRALAVGSVGSTLTRLFSELEARTIEINPLTFAADGTAIALDAKVDLDEDAAFRRTRDVPTVHGSAYERRAAELGLTFVPLDGEVALFGMGAGLTLTALDLVCENGSRAANFSELRGGLGPEQVEANFELILDWVADTPQVKAILLLASLVGTPLRSYVTGVADALRDRDTTQVPRVVAAIHATGASLYTMSREQAQATLGAVGVEWIEDVRDAAREAATTPAAVPAGGLTP